MKSGTVTTILLALALAACGDETPPPKLSKPAPPPSPAPGPQAKAPLTPKLAEPTAVPRQPSADQALADRVKAALRAERGVNAERIDITAKDGTVTLFGTTETRMQRDIAVKVAAAVAGVKSVENKLQVVAGS